MQRTQGHPSHEGATDATSTVHARARVSGLVGGAVAAALVLTTGWRVEIGHAQQAQVPSTLAGAWSLASPVASAEHTVESAFAANISTLPELFQGFARSRVRSSMAPPRRVDVTLTDARLRVRLESSERTTVIDGALNSAANVSGAEGTPTVTPRLSGGWLELAYEGEGSELRQLLSTEPDGARMHLDFRIVSPQMPTPVRYRLDYVRRTQ